MSKVDGSRTLLESPGCKCCLSSGKSLNEAPIVRSDSSEIGEDRSNETTLSGFFGSGAWMEESVWTAGSVAVGVLSVGGLFGVCGLRSFAMTSDSTMRHNSWNRQRMDAPAGFPQVENGKGYCLANRVEHKVFRRNRGNSVGITGLAAR